MYLFEAFSEMCSFRHILFPFLVFGAISGNSGSRIVNVGTAQCLDFSYFPQKCDSAEKSQEFTFTDAENDTKQIKNVDQNKCLFSAAAQTSSKGKSSHF